MDAGMITQGEQLSQVTDREEENKGTRDVEGDRAIKDRDRRKLMD